MADIAAVQLANGEAFTQHTPTATASGGDNITISSQNNPVLIAFDNGAVGAVTATIAVSTTAGRDPTSGAWTKSNLSLSIPAGELRWVYIRGTNLGAYLTAGKIAITYTSHDVALLVSAAQFNN